MPKTVVEKSRPRTEQDGAAALAIPAARPSLRLARRHRLSKARGLMLGVLIGLAIWGLVAALLHGML